MAEPDRGCPVFLVHAERTTDSATEWLIMACQNRSTARERAVGLWLTGYRNPRIHKDWSLSWADVQQMGHETGVSPCDTTQRNA